MPFHHHFPALVLDSSQWKDLTSQECPGTKAKGRPRALQPSVEKIRLENGLTVSAPLFKPSKCVTIANCLPAPSPGVPWALGPSSTTSLAAGVTQDCSTRIPSSSHSSNLVHGTNVPTAGPSVPKLPAVQMHEDEAEWNGFPGLTTQTYNSSYAEEASHTGVQPNYSVPDCQCLIFQCFVPKYFPPNLLDYVAAPISQSSPDCGPANMQLAAQASNLKV